MRTLRRINKLAPRRVRRGAFDLNDAHALRDEHDADADANGGDGAIDTAPEAVFDRVTGPYGGSYVPSADHRRRGAFGGYGLGSGFDEET